MLKSIFFTLCLSFTIGCLQAQDFPEGELLVQLIVDKDAKEVFDLTQRSMTSTRLKKTVSNRLNLHLISFDPQQISSESLIKWFTQHPHIVFADYNYQVSYRANPNDPGFELQDDMQLIQAPQAWDFTTGGLTANGDTIVVATLEPGCDIFHEDLRDNIWRNHREIPGDSIDNDQNGYIDDYWGLNIKKGNDVHPIINHGTTVCGIIGAKGNNIKGISGVCWNVKNLLLTGIVTLSEVFEAYEYVINLRQLYKNTNGQQGAFIVATNASFGIPDVWPEDAPIYNMWCEFFESMGNLGILTASSAPNNNTNVDDQGDMPTTCTSDFLVTVTNTNEFDERLSNAGYGLQHVDLSAPGTNIYNVRSNNEYTNAGTGTSYSAPHVTGAMALIYSVPCRGLVDLAISNPSQAALLVKELILNGTDPISSLNDEVSSGGRLNLLKTVQGLYDHFGQQDATLGIHTAFPNPTHNNLTIRFLVSSTKIYTIIIFDSSGRQVYEVQKELSCSSPPLVFDVQDYAKGTYFASIRNGKEIATKRFVVY